jgi:hypothetical protein
MMLLPPLLLLVLLVLLPGPCAAPKPGCGTPGLPSCDGGHPLGINPLRGLPALRKPHFSWPLYPPFLHNASVADSAVVDYARITGSLCPSETDAHTLMVAAQVLHLAGLMGNRKPTLAINYGCFPGAGASPASCGPQCQTKGATEAEAFFRGVAHSLAAANTELGSNVSVGAVMFDCEEFTWSDETDPAALANKNAITRLNEALHNATRRVFPDEDAVQLVWYGLGSANWSPTIPAANCSTGKCPVDCRPHCPECHRGCRECRLATSAAAGGGSPDGVLPAGWCVAPAYYTHREAFIDSDRSSAYSPVLYSVPEPSMTRELFATSAALARARGLPRGGAVIPYIGLGFGLRRNVSVTGTGYGGSVTHYENNFRYDEGYDALLGAQMNKREYERSPFGEWQQAVAAVLFPSPFDEPKYGNFPSRHTAGSTNSFDHFVAYVRGAVE